MKKLMLLPVAALLAFALTGCSEDSPTTPAPDTNAAATFEKVGRPDRMATYEIVIENLTPATGAGSSQPFSPPILATHRADMHVFEAGKLASAHVAGVAEDAMNGPLVDALWASDRVNDVAVGGDVVLPGGDMTFTIKAAPGKARLSAIFMLVNTNDAFGGLDGIRLPQHGEAHYMVPVWDAGSELNTEAMSDIPGPCCGNPGMGTDESEPIMMHQGIMGTGDLDAAVYGWEGPAARLTVRRID